MIDPIEKELANRDIKFAPAFRQHNRKQNEVVKAAYAMYLTGKSIAEVARVYRKSRQALYEQFKARGFALRSKQLRGLTIVDGVSFTLMKGGYLRGTLPDGRRVLLHHYLWEKANGPIPAGLCVHHLDRHPENNDLANLTLVKKSDMAKVFSGGRNQFSPGGSGRKKGQRIKEEWEARFRRIGQM